MRKCIYDLAKVCFHYPCDFIDLQGNVCLCKHHRNPRGRFTRRKGSPSVLERGF